MSPISYYYGGYLVVGLVAHWFGTPAAPLPITSAWHSPPRWRLQTACGMLLGYSGLSPPFRGSTHGHWRSGQRQWGLSGHHLEHPRSSRWLEMLHSLGSAGRASHMCLDSQCRIYARRRSPGPGFPEDNVVVASEDGSSLDRSLLGTPGHRHQRVPVFQSHPRRPYTHT